MAAGVPKSFVVVVVVIISIILEQFNLNERVLRSCDGAYNNRRCMCLATAYICNEEDSTSIPSDVVEAFVPAWTYLPHDVELIKRSVELREGSEKQMLDNMIMDKFELLPGELCHGVSKFITRCRRGVSTVRESFRESQ